MSRIDREALIAAIKNEMCGDGCGGSSAVCGCCDIRHICDLIRDQPTVDQHRWIPATELPPNDNEVLVWFEYFRYGSYQRLYRTTGIGRTFRGEWSNFVDGVSGWSSLKILAWMPLPAPPTPEECSAVGKED